MSTKLPLFDRLLTLARNYLDMHRDRAARRVLRQLTRNPNLPARIAEETHVLLAELLLKHRQPQRASCSLAVALRLRPDNARYHFLMATACAAPKEPDFARAARHYRQSLQLDPKQPECLSKYGLLLVKTGKESRGLKLLHQAAELAPDDATVTKRLIGGLRRTGQASEARQVLIAARFRNPRDGRFRRLYNDFMFRQLRSTQQQAQQRFELVTDDLPALLPFVRVLRETEAVRAEQKLIRLDPASTTAAPHTLPRSARRSDWKHG